nr:hypothetical protein [Streptomyces sp. STR69]
MTAEHRATAPELEPVQCASHGFDHVDVDAAQAQGCSSAPSAPELADRAVRQDPLHRGWVPSDSKSPAGQPRST